MDLFLLVFLTDLLTSPTCVTLQLVLVAVCCALLQLLFCNELAEKNYVAVTREKVRLLHLDQFWSRWVPTEEVYVLGCRYSPSDGINYTQLV